MARLGLGDGGRELAPLEQQLRLDSRGAASVEEAALRGGRGWLDVEGPSLSQQNIAACARAARPLIEEGFNERGAARSWPQVQTEASLPPQRHKRRTSGPAAASEARSLRPFGSAGAMGLNLRAAERRIRGRVYWMRGARRYLLASAPKTPRALQSLPLMRQRQNPTRRCTCHASASSSGARGTFHIARRACPSSSPRRAGVPYVGSRTNGDP